MQKKHRHTTRVVPIIDQLLLADLHKGNRSKKSALPAWEFVCDRDGLQEPRLKLVLRLNGKYLAAKQSPTQIERYLAEAFQESQGEIAHHLSAVHIRTEPSRIEIDTIPAVQAMFDFLQKEEKLERYPTFFINVQPDALKVAPAVYHALIEDALASVADKGTVIEKLKPIGSAGERLDYNEKLIAHLKQTIVTPSPVSETPLHARATKPAPSPLGEKFMRDAAANEAFQMGSSGSYKERD